MTWLLIVVLAVVVILALLTVLVLAAFLGDEGEADRVRIEMEIRRAERRLHDVARNSFEAMLDEARAPEQTRVS